MRPLFVSFFTPIYAEEAHGLLRTLILHGLDHDIREIESQSSWERNCSRKASFLAEMRTAHPGRPLVWVDADARVRRYPALLDSLTCDFAAHWRNGHELLSGTMYWGATAKADELLAAWSRASEAMPDIMDQRTLQNIVDGWDGRVVRLPPEYTAIFDGDMAPEAAWVISHHQASRRLRGVAI